MLSVLLNETMANVSKKTSLNVPLVQVYCQLCATTLVLLALDLKPALTDGRIKPLDPILENFLTLLFKEFLKSHVGFSLAELVSTLLQNFCIRPVRGHKRYFPSQFTLHCILNILKAQ